MKKIVLASLTALTMTGLMTSVSAQTIPQNENVMQLIPVSREEGEKIYKQIENDMKVNGIKRAVPEENTNKELAAATQIFTFPFTFDSNLKSRDFKVNKTTMNLPHLP
ncbi:hypothetical protein [Aneurinibacillus thermoaerophilus]|uniref:Uncharacterized protein n=1 Tax=Aneurinibacillus thermoaerophilus TaxID=143495 RepID=A0ABX8Y9C7_ANETH|nr:hypothetical protein [Aneurinibacillus thermoaerophilus]MED0736567.1 hypothetical protein [Aneurinibacillus thermoaerophilus]QYY42005.1 hypothetical protein K3F53_14155 [Aneurinibacillus thermoaerophilus]